MAGKNELSPRVVLRFGVFQVNLAARELYKHGVRVRLPGQPFSILSMLLEKPGEILTRDEIRHKLWASDTFVDFEHSMNSAIKKLRAALGDTPENSKYVETIPRIGYRFIAPVDVVAVAVPIEEVPIPGERAAPPNLAQKIGKREWIAILVSFLTIVAGSSVYFKWPRSQGARKTVAASEIRTESKSSESNKPKNGLASSPAAGEAHDLYLRGMYFWNKRTGAGFQGAIECFQQAIAKDPNYAQAYSGLATSYTLLTAYASASASLYIPQARAAVSRSLELDPNSAEAHTALALIVQNHDWDWQASEKEYQRAIELDPKYATAHQWYAEHLMWLGRFDEALSESKKAVELDPLSLIIASDYGAILYYSRQYDRAIEQFHIVLQKDPTFNRADLITLAYVEKGMYGQALGQEAAMRRLYGDGPGYWMRRAYIYGRAGKQKEARRELAKVENFARHEHTDPVVMLWPHLGIGNKDEALADLETAYTQHLSIMVTLKVEPAFDPLRSDPRFQDLLRRVHLEE